MNKFLATVGMVSFVLLATDGVWAQETSPSGLRQPETLQQTSYDYEAAPAIAPSPSPSDVPAPQAAQAPAAIPEEALPAGPEAAPADKPWTLPQPCVLQRHGIALGGWLQQGITFNAQNPASRFNGPVATNDRDAEYQMNQLWLFLNRPIDTGGCGWDLGGRLDMIYGTDFRFGINHGLEDRINALDQYYGLVIPQAYVEVGVNDLSFKLGHFAGLLSYEQVPAVANFFYSHSYTMGYGEPLLVTGAIGTYKLCDHWSVTAGFHRGWMMFEDYNDDMDVTGAVTYTGDDKRDSLTFAVDNGPQDAAGERNCFVYSLIAQKQLTDDLHYVLQHDLGFQEDSNPRTGDDAHWYSVVQYLMYTINPCWSAGMRFEWFRDADGARVAGVGNLCPGHGWDALPGFEGDFYELTLGLNWRPSLNLVVRPEVRWDWYNGTPNLAPQNELPFGDGASDNQFLFGVDAILTY